MGLRELWGAAAHIALIADGGSGNRAAVCVPWFLADGGTVTAIDLLLSIVLLGLSLWVLVRAAMLPRGERSRLRLSLGLEALLSAGVSLYLLLYVIGEDNYRDDGTSRWEAYDAHSLTVVALIAGCATVAITLVAARGRNNLAPVSGALGVVSALILGLAFLANSLN